MVNFLQRFIGRTRQKPAQGVSGEDVREEQIEVLVDFTNEFGFDQIYPSLREAMRQKPKVLLVELLGVGAIPMDLCLLVWDLFTQRKDESTRLDVWCSTSIIDGEVLFLLGADRLRIRENTWLQLSSIEDFVQNDRSRGWKRSADSESWQTTNYRNVVKIVDAYLPVESLAAKGRVDLRSTFREFGLLNNDQEEQSFRELFKVEPVQV
jgi:hypothetical protein